MKVDMVFDDIIPVWSFSLPQLQTKPSYTKQSHPPDQPSGHTIT